MLYLKSMRVGRNIKHKIDYWLGGGGGGRGKHLDGRVESTNPLVRGKKLNILI